MPTPPTPPASSTKLMELGTPRTVALDEIKPYWRNPRRVTEEAVNAVRESIERFGYQQPIVVDEDLVIIVGHTRYAALRRMKVTEVPVMVATTLTAAQVKQYRLIDNKVGELSSWDFASLVDELSELDQSLVQLYFPEIGDAATERFASDQDVLVREWDKVNPEVEFVCPSCFHQWEMTVTRDALLAGLLKVPA